MQAKMNGRTVLDSMETKHKVKSLESLRSGPKVNGKKLVIDSLKLFNRLIIIIEREVKTKEALRFELTPTPMFLFDKDQKLRKPDKAGLHSKFHGFKINPNRLWLVTSRTLDL